MQQNILKIKSQIIDLKIFSSKYRFKWDANLNKCKLKRMFTIYNHTNLNNYINNNHWYISVKLYIKYS